MKNEIYRQLLGDQAKETLRQNKTWSRNLTAKSKHLLTRPGWRCHLLVACLVIGWLGAASAARATCQEGCLSNFNTALGEDALLNPGPVANTVVGYNAGKSLVTGGDDNTAIGQYALTSDRLGGFNTAIGVDALYSNQVANGNTAVGFAALSNNGGDENTAVGEDALYNNTVGYNNVAIGTRALLNSGGNFNTAIGSGALQNNAASGNTAVGTLALVSNTTGDQNTAVGDDALQDNTGSGNTAVGYLALVFNITGDGNTAVGDNALSYNSTGRENSAYGDGALAFNPIGDNNTALGSSTIRFVSSGSNNTAVGYSALFGQSLNRATGSDNTATGAMALANFTSGSNNTAVGNNALLNNTTGNSNIAIGLNAGVNLTTGSNNIDIFEKGVAGESNTIRIGRKGSQTATHIAGISGATVAGGVAVLIDTTGRLGTLNSSARYKEAIQPMDKASEAILALRPVSFRYKKELDPERIPQFGLVAEEVERVNPDLVARDDQGKPYTVRYEAVNAMLLNEFLKEHEKVEEQQATIAELKSTVAQQQKGFQSRLAKQQEQIEALTAAVQKVSARVEMSRPAPQTVVSNP